VSDGQERVAASAFRQKRSTKATAATKEEYDWPRDITMPDDDTQTLADVLAAMRANDLQRYAAFVEWLANDWYDARQALAEAEDAR
jgi:hypothetical protein